MIPPWTKIVRTAFVAGVLDEEEHAPLLANIEHVERVSGIPLTAICSSMRGVCEEREILWVQKFRTHEPEGRSGMLYLGGLEPPYVERALAVTAALVRNFVDARMVSVDTLVSRAWDGETLTPTCLVVPDFGVSGRPVSVRRALAGVVMDRALKCKQTVLHAPSIEFVTAEYGEAIRDLLSNKFFWFS